MGRPPSADPKQVVTLRLRRSTLDAYKAAGEDWRSRMEAAIEGAMVSVAPTMPPAPKAAHTKPSPSKAKSEPERSRIVNRLKGEWKAP